MSINLQINIKGASRKINQLEYEYKWQPGDQVTINDFLNETVDITYNRYKNTLVDKDRAEIEDQDLVKEKNDKLVQFIKVLSNEEINEKAETGKVSFGIHYNPKLDSIEKAKENAIQCFKDGLIALFIDVDRYENLEDMVTLKEGSQVTFVKMVFLAGRMW